MNTTARHSRSDNEDVVAGAVLRLAEALTALRRESGLSLDQFAEAVGLTKPRLMLVETGNLVPDHDVMYAYLELPRLRPTERHRLRSLWGQAQRVPRHEAAGNDLDPVLAQLDTFQLRRVDHRAKDDLRQDVDLALTKPSWRRLVTKSQADPKLWPDPARVMNVEEFTAALGTIKSSTGLSYEALAAASQRASYPLARSTVHALCTKPRLPSSPKAVACFIDICGGRRVDIESWVGAWQRLAQQRSVPASPADSEDTDEQFATSTASEPSSDSVVIGEEPAHDAPLLRLVPLSTDVEQSVVSPSAEPAVAKGTTPNLVLVLGLVVVLVFIAGLIAGGVILR